MDFTVKQVQWCPLCEKLGCKRRLKLCQINLEEAVWICENEKCPYPLGTGSVSSIIVQRKSSEIGNKRKRKTRPEGKDGNVRKMSKTETSSVSEVSSVITCSELDELLDFLGETKDESSVSVSDRAASESVMCKRNGEVTSSISPERVPVSQSMMCKPDGDVKTPVSRERVPVSQSVMCKPNGDVKTSILQENVPVSQPCFSAISGTEGVLVPAVNANIDVRKTGLSNTVAPVCNNSASNSLSALLQKPYLDQTRDKKPFKRKVFGGYTPGEKTKIVNCEKTNISHGGSDTREISSGEKANITNNEKTILHGGDDSRKNSSGEKMNITNNEKTISHGGNDSRKNSSGEKANIANNEKTISHGGNDSRKNSSGEKANIANNEKTILLGGDDSRKNSSGEKMNITNNEKTISHGGIDSRHNSSGEKANIANNEKTTSQRGNDSRHNSSGEKANIANNEKTNALPGSSDSRENCHTANNCRSGGSNDEGNKSRDGLESCLQWPNHQSLCWLDAVLCTLVHCKSLHTLLESLNGKGTSIIKELHQKYNKATNSVFSTHPSTAATSGHHHRNLDQATQTLHEIREKIWSYLQPKMKCEVGREDTPVLALPLLINENKRIQEQFLLKYHWKFVCTVCGYQQIDRLEKTLVTFPNVPADFDISQPCFVRPCYQCKAANQRSTMVIDRIPDCVMMHFVEGLPTKRLDNYHFVNGDSTYSVSTVIQYTDNPKHFIAWCKHPCEQLWVKCDDLQSPVCWWSKETPNIPGSEVHVVLWERQTTEKNKSNPQSVTACQDQHSINTKSELNGPKTRRRTRKQGVKDQTELVTTPPSSSRRKIVPTRFQINRVKGEKVKGHRKSEESNTQLSNSNKTVVSASQKTAEKEPPSKNLASTTTPDSSKIKSVLSKIPSMLFGTGGTHSVKKTTGLVRKPLKTPALSTGGQRSTRNLNTPLIGQQGTNSNQGQRLGNAKSSGNEGSKSLPGYQITGRVAVQCVGMPNRSGNFSGRKSFTGYVSATERQNTSASFLPKSIIGNPILVNKNPINASMCTPWQSLAHTNKNRPSTIVKKRPNSISYSDQSSPSSVSSAGSTSSREDLFSSVHDELCKALDINEYDSGISSQVSSPIDDNFFSSIISENTDESSSLMDEVLDKFNNIPIGDLV